jgi:DNA-binding NtrC family response regulator
MGIAKTPGTSKVSTANEEMRTVLARIEQLAPTAVPVVLLGETGVGKGWLAGVLHAQSGVKGALVHVPCPGIPESLFESELFGHLRGSFTGAEQPRAGKLTAARDGTLFLDEIADLGTSVQAKLLVALEAGEYFPIGSDRTVRSNFRLVSCTNKDLPHVVKEGQFRADLYHRLGAAHLVLPPLRRRREDIPALAMAFLTEARLDHVAHCEGFEPEALDALLEYPWPGNVRELRSVITLATVACTSSRIHLADVAPYLTVKASPTRAAEPSSTVVQSWKEALRQFETHYWTEVLAAANGSRKAAAALAGVSERHLFRKLRMHVDSTPATAVTR